MDYKELIDTLRNGDLLDIFVQAYEIANAIETLLKERDAAVEDLTFLCQDSGDSCFCCEHLPCVDENGNGHCIGWQWRGPQEGGGDRQ